MRKTLLACSLILASCGGGGGRGDVPLDQMPAELAAVYCQKAAACCTSTELTDVTGAASEAQCEQLFGGLFGGLLLPVFNDGIDHGRLVYHADRMGDCLDVMDQMSCAEFAATEGGGNPLGTCSDPFEGLVAVDGQCGNDADCVSGYCSGESIDGNGNITYGTCKTPPAASQPCDSGTCADGLWCDSGTCAEPQADGAACTSGEECASHGCNGYDPNGPTPGTCGAPTVCDGV